MIIRLHLSGSLILRTKRSILPSLVYLMALDKILEIINKVFNFEPNNIIKELDLTKPIYHLTTCFGHFGKNNLPWEKLDKVEIIKSLLN